MTKKIRQQVWDKSNGKCWYCGRVLLKTGWQVDHVKPISRGGDKEDIDNMVPTCAACNRFKMVLDVEEFRYRISNQIVRGRLTSVSFRVAERFGMIEITKKPIIFWYEKKQIEKNKREEKVDLADHIKTADSIWGVYPDGF